MDTPKQLNKGITAIIVVVLIAAVTTATLVLGNQSNGSKKSSASTVATTAANSNTTSSAGSVATTQSTTSGQYKNGTYSATSSYQTPEDQESIDVQLTLSGGIITDATVSQNPNNRESGQYQDEFASAYKSEVVGKKIDDVSLSRVAGSSLTSNGFNSALETIKSQASA